MTITPDDGDKTVCVAIGGTVIVDLTSTDGSRWQPLDIGGNVLTQKGTPASDATGNQKATLAATSVGTAIDHVRPPRLPVVARHDQLPRHHRLDGHGRRQILTPLSPPESGATPSVNSPTDRGCRVTSHLRCD